MYYKTRSYRIFYAANLIFLLAVSILCILPMIHILAVSFSGASAADNHLVGLWPVDFKLEAYKKTIGNPLYLNSIWISVKRVFFATGLSMLITILTAYPLSKRTGVLQGRPFFLWLFVFAMLFTGGLVPSYVLISKIGLMNSFWVLVFPNAVQVYNVILMLNFFRGIPRELEEAAFIDGAGHLRTLVLIYLPLSLSSLATLSLFTIVFNWNAYFDGLIYLSNREAYPLSTLLRTIVVQIDPSSIRNLSTDALNHMSDRTLKASQVFLGALPVIIIYPFFQRFFVKGVVLGAVKE
ncbi:carbohydrate ABC transporter permease [Paenibacillus sp. HB172176]|uniref:carbohydrate ABC transporter permease n=1 Tax=Paenibacillus sp. HB172176 TaxID=2493690 RepID=UPI00143A4FDC|nr:carbohydrate ABC transporter permease [Paenibacillus sp. HB172176]